jgi:hypothetical protein
MPILGKRKRPKHDTWLTPRWVLDPLGPFDLDPCAAPSPRPFRIAERNIELPKDGLLEPWAGRVWLNPPFSNIKPWIRRMAEHGNGVALVPGRVETQWFHDWVWDRAGAVFVFRRRVNFCDQSGAVKTGVDFPTILAAYGQANITSLRTCGLVGRFIKL